MILLFLILFARLFETQIIKGDYYRDLSQGNRIRHVVLPAPRGRILAANGEELATNVAVKKRVKFDEVGGFIVTDDLTGMKDEEEVTDYMRVYPLKEKFSHPIGYLAQIGPEQVDKINPDCPEKGPGVSNTFVGKTGLEESYECILAGIPGEELIEVNTKGTEVRVLGRKNPIPGRDLTTSINYELQKETADAMEGKMGAAIVTGKNGQILAFYSYPTFDPNLFIGKNNSNEISALLKDKSLPFFDRVISGTFHPGSVFKPVVALSALEEGKIDKNFTYKDMGSISVNGFTYNNWYLTQYGRTEGIVNLTSAMARSTDTFFYTIGAMVGPENIAKWAKIFGLDSLTGIDISGEKHGLIPTPEWKKEVKKEMWYLGNTYHMAIGQGDVSVTPIEINNYIAAIAQNGEMCPPHFAVGDFYKEKCKRIDISQKNISLLKQGMEAVCETGGTAYPFFDFADKHQGLTVACKTGTAQVGTDGSTHAWFTIFAPSDNAEITSTILIENGGEGSSVAGPIARKIFDLYFTSKQQ